LIMRHPVPIGPVHLLAVSRSGIPDAVADHAAADAFWGALASWLDQHAAGHGVVAGLTNLGDRQEVRLPHVHLIGAAPAWADRLLGEGAAGATAATLPELLARLRADRSLSGSTATIAVLGDGSAGWRAVVERPG